MSVSRVLSFFINILFNAAALMLIAYAVFTVSAKSFDFGKDIANNLAEDLEEAEIIVVVEEGSNISDVADLLEEKGVIKSALSFKLESILKGNDYIFDGGEIKLNTKMSTNEIIYALLEKPVFSQDILITINEGYTLKDIAAYLESKEVVTAEEFIKACNESEFYFSFLKDIPERENRLEGYLFPDTYYVAENTTPEAVINKMLARFEEIYTPYMEKAKEMGLSMDEVITIASIIEKEIKVSSERPKAAQVIYNRIEAGQKLEMCSTILYVLDKRKDRLYFEDLQVESPYNTYINEGLPVGPIANPGEACILAALNPSEGDLLYFVVKDEETGEHVFTNSYDEFLRAKDLYNQTF